MTRRALRPTQWAGLAMAGACLMTASLLVVAIPRSWFPPVTGGVWETLWSRRLFLLAMLTPLVVGGGLTLWAKRGLDRSFLDDQWSDAELAAVLRIVDLPIWKIGGLVSVLGWIVLMVSRHTFLGGGMIYLSVLPAQVAQNIRSRLAPNAPVSLGPSGWGSFPRLQSDHWGEGRP